MYLEKEFEAREKNKAHRKLMGRDEPELRKKMEEIERKTTESKVVDVSAFKARKMKEMESYM